MNQPEFKGTGRRPWHQHKPILQTNSKGLIHYPPFLSGIYVSDLTPGMKELVEGAS